jgi:hypothetical protein
MWTQRIFRVGDNRCCKVLYRDVDQRYTSDVTQWATDMLSQGVQQQWFRIRELEVSPDGLWYYAVLDIHHSCPPEGYRLTYTTPEGKTCETLLFRPASSAELFLIEEEDEEDEDDEKDQKQTAVKTDEPHRLRTWRVSCKEWLQDRSKEFSVTATEQSKAFLQVVEKPQKPSEYRLILRADRGPVPPYLYLYIHWQSQRLLRVLAT